MEVSAAMVASEADEEGSVEGSVEALVDSGEAVSVKNNIFL